MWVLRYLFFSVMLGVFGLVVLLFLGQNQRIEQLNFFGLEYTTNLVWVLLGAAVIGILVTLVLLLPGRLAGTVHSWSLEREVRQLEQGLARLQEQRERVLARHELLLETHERVLQSYQRLVAEYGRVAAERDRVRSQLAALDASAASASARSAKAAGAAGVAGAPVTIKEHAAPHLAIVAPTAAGAAVTAVVRSHPRNAYPIAAAPAHVTPEPVARPTAGSSHAHDVPAAAERDADKPVSLASPASAVHAPISMAPTLKPVSARQAQVIPAGETSPASTPVAPAATPAPPVAAQPLAPTKPASASSSLPVPVAQASIDTPAPSLPPASASVNDSDSVPLTQHMAAQLERARGRLREDVAGMAALLTDRKVILAAKLARLKLSMWPGDPSSATSTSSDGTANDQPSSDD